MAKKVAEQVRNIREAVFGISKQIDINFRNYALYVLEHRGIPSFYDSLTNVQRVSLMNAPKTFSKTISLVGAAITDGYHHGDCLQASTEIILGDDSVIKIEDWYKKYPDVKLILKSYNEKTGELCHATGHSPRIGQYATEIFEIELENGTIESCTNNHPWFTQRGWIKTEDLLESDEIIDFDQIYQKNIKMLKMLK